MESNGYTRTCAWIATAALSCMALAQLGCIVEQQRSEGALAFNQELTTIGQRRESEAGPLMRPIILGWASGLENSASSSNRRILRLLDRSIADVEALPVPDVELAPELHAAVLEFLRKERAVFSSDIAVMIGALHDPRLSMDQKRLKVWEGLENASVKSDRYLRKVKQVQTDFANRHGFALRTSPPKPIWNVES